MSAPVENARVASSRSLSIRASAWVRSDAGLAALVFAGAVILLVARAWFAHEQFWTEDGTIFYEQARVDGLGAFGNAYAGYFLFVPRVIGAITALGPVESAPTVTWVCVLLVTGWCATTIALATPPWLRSPITRGTLALAVVLLPSLGGESLAASSDLHFTMMFVTLVVLIGTTRGRWQTANSVVFVFLTGLSTLLSALLLPFALFRFFALTKNRARDWVSFAWAAGVGVQLLLIAVVRPTRSGSSSSTVASIVKGYAYDVVLGNVSPFDADRRVFRGLAIALTAAVFALIAVAAVASWRRQERTRAVLLVGVPGAGLAYWVGSGLRLALAPRYEVFAALCLIWALLAAADSVTRPQLRTRVRVAVGAALVLCWLASWAPSAYRHDGPSWTSTLAAAERTCARTGAHFVRVEIMPHNGRWHVRLPCRDVG